VLKNTVISGELIARNLSPPRWSLIIDKLLKLRIQESAATLASLWWLILLIIGGIGVIAFSQLTFSTDKKIQATVLSIGTTEGMIGDEVFLMVKTDEDVTSKVMTKFTSKDAVTVGDVVTLNVLDRVVFRDRYRLD